MLNFLIKTIIWLVTCIEYPMEKCFAHRNGKHNILYTVDEHPTERRSQNLVKVLFSQ